MPENRRLRNRRRDDYTRAGACVYVYDSAAAGVCLSFVYSRGEKYTRSYVSYFGVMRLIFLALRLFIPGRK